MKPFCRFAILLCMLAVTTPSLAVMRAMRIERHLDDMKRVLAKIPYTSEGSGPVIYILQHTDCLPCRRFALTFTGKDLGVELRHILIAESDATANTAAMLAQSRDINDFRKLMDKIVRAPSYKSSPQSRAALDSVLEPIRDWILPIMKKNGYTAYGIEAPIFFWEQLGVLFMEEGYDVVRFDQIMQSAKMTMDDIRVPPEEIILIDNQKLILPPLADEDENGEKASPPPADATATSVGPGGVPLPAAPL